MKRPLIKIMAMLLVVIMFVGVLPMNAFAASIYNDSNGGSDYYNVISEKNGISLPASRKLKLF